MPNCFQLISKKTQKPESFAVIDEELCKYLNVPVDAERYVYEWYDSIGLGLAFGHDFNKLREIFADTRLTPIIEYLDKHYTSDAWHEVGRRG